MSTAPITKIPNELLMEIFLHMFIDPITFPSNDFSIRLRLMRVCRRWQSVALEQGPLWSNICIEYVKDRETKNLGILERAHACLRLSKNCPLTIGVIHTFAMDPDIDGHLISDIIIPYAKTIIDLEIYARLPIFQSILLLPAGSFPLLQSLAIFAIPSRHNKNLLPKVRNVFSGTPDLRSVDAANLPHSLTDLGIPLSQLQKLSFVWRPQFPLQKIVNDLKSCVALRSCTMTNCIYYEGNEPPTHIFAEMPRLKKLLLHGRVAHEDGRCVPIVAPGLEDLTIWSTVWPPGVLAAFIMRSRCTIVRLKVSGVSATFLDEFLEHVPSIEALDIGATPLTPSAIRNMGSGTVCPALTSLKCSARRETFREFLDMLVSRVQGQGTGSPSRIVDVEIDLISLDVGKSRILEWLEGRGICIRLWDIKRENRTVFNDEDFIPPL